MNWTAISVGFASGADLSLAGSGQRAAGSGSPSHGPGPAFRRYGLSPRSAPGPGLSLESDAFRCPHRLERHKRPKSMPGTHFKNDSDQTGSQPRSSVIVHRSSFIVHRPFVRCSSAGRSRPVSSYLSSIVYLAGILRSLRSYAPYGPGCLPTNRTPVCRWLLCNRLSTSTSTSAPASPYQRSTGLS